MLRKRLLLTKSTPAIKSDAQLKQEARANSHVRQQQFEDALNWIVCRAIIWLPVSVFLAGIIYLGHLVLAGDWEGFRSILYSLVSALAGYLVSVLQKRGLRSSKS